MAGVERRAIKRHPTQIRPTQRVAHCRRQPGFRIQFRRIQIHRHLLGDDGIAVLQRRHFVHRVDGQKLGRAMLARGQVEGAHFIVGAQRFEQHARTSGTAAR